MKTICDQHATAEVDSKFSYDIKLNRLSDFVDHLQINISLTRLDYFSLSYELKRS